MALKGTIYKNVGSGYRLQLEWTATQDTANNKSTIEAKLYWMSLGSSYTISSGTKSGRVEIGGTGADFSATASLSGNQKKLVSTYSRTVSHDSEGKLSVSLKGIFSINVTLSGTYYGTQTVSGTAYLDDIARESSITSSLNFTAPNGFPISISRANNSYTHTVRLYVDGTLIKTSTGVGSGITWGFEDSEMTAIFNKLAQRRSCPLQLQLDTYSGSTKIGSTKSYNGTVFAEFASTNVNDPSFNIGDNYKVSVARNNSNFKHKVIFRVGGVEIHRSPDYFDYTYDWIPTAAEKTKAFDTVKTKNSTGSQIELITYYNGVQVNNAQIQDGTAKVVNSDPTFTAGFVYEDINATTLALTGDKYSIIQKASIPKVTIPVASKATAKNSASIVNYSASLDGQTLNAAYSDTGDVTFQFKPVTSSQNLTLTITAIDSRGNTTKASKTVTVIPYSPPTTNVTVRRKNGFEIPTLLNLSGSISPLTVGGVNKNALVKAEYRYRENISTTVYPSTWTALPVQTNALTYSTTEQSIDLVQDKQYIFQIRVTDKAGEAIIEKTVNKGKPIFMIDEKLGSVGIGRFPVLSGSLEMAGQIKNAGNISATNPANESAEAYLGWLNNIARIRVGGTGTGSVNGFQIHGTGDKVLMSLDNSQGMQTGNIKLSLASQFLSSGKFGLDMNNSDMKGLNGMYWSDTADGASEGLNFPKTGTASGASDTSLYDSIWAKDGKMFFNGVDIINPIVNESPSFLNGWSGYFNPKYIKTHHGVVVLQGMIRNGALGTIAFKFPASCCPTSDQLLYVPMANGNHVRCDITAATGEFKVSSVSGGNAFDASWLNLNGISFMTV